MFTQANDSSTRSRSRRGALLMVLMAGALFVNCAHALISVGPDAACQFHDIGSAVAAADQTPGPDVVAISTGTYTGVSTMIISSADSLVIEGGYLNCSAGIPTGTSTLDASGASNRGSLIVHIGAGRLSVRHLVLTNGDAGAGGGIDSEGSGELILSDVMLLTNNADYGGGMFVAGAIPHKQVTLINTKFNSNTARGNGGGLFALYADVTIISGGESYFLGNFAQGSITNTGDGAGIYALNSNIVANTHGVFGFPFIGSNHAQRHGGGVFFSVTEPGNYEFLLANDDAVRPLEVADNSADEGGGVYMKAYSQNQPLNTFARFSNTIFRNNQALHGAAISMDAYGDQAPVFTDLRLHQSVAGDAIPPCASGLRCNSFEGNLSYNGYIIAATSGGPQGGGQVEFLRGSMIANHTVDSGGGLIFGGDTRLNIDGSLFADNELSGEIATVVSDNLRFANSTVAHNTIGADQLFTVAITPASLDILHSLLSQPNDPVNGYVVGSSIPATVRDVGAENVNISGNNVQFLSDPFVDAAGGDYHIRLTSSAVDRWVPTGDPNDPAPTLDLDGASRPYSFNSSSTPYDFGAYEAGATVDAIFINGFD
jgi:hypothetical protein